MTTEGTETRIQALELQVSKLKRGLGMALIMSFVFFASIILVFSKTASVRWVGINDRDGKLAGWWDQDGLQIYDAKGDPRIKIGMVGDEPSIQLFHTDKKMKAQAFVYPDGSGYVMAWDKNGKGERFPASKEPMP